MKAENLEFLFIDLILSLMTPGGKLKTLSSNFFGTDKLGSEEKRPARAARKKVFKKIFVNKENFRDSSFANLLRESADIFNIDKSEFDQYLLKINDAIIRSQRRSYPFGILGFVSEEILPVLSDFVWIKPSIDHFIKLDQELKSINHSSGASPLNIPSYDVIDTLVGQRCKTQFETANGIVEKNDPIRKVYLITLWQFLTALVLGANENAENVKNCAVLLRDNSGKTAVSNWFYAVRQELCHSDWREIDSALRSAMAIELNYNDEARREGEKTRMPQVRSGAVALRLDQCDRFLTSFADASSSAEIIVTLEKLRKWYRVAIITDNFRREWREAFPDQIEFEDALPRVYSQMKGRWDGAWQATPQAT